MNLKQYARKHTSGGITWFLMPYQTLKNQTISREFASIVPLEARGYEENLFVAMEAFTVDVEFADALTIEEQIFAEYWRNRPAAMADRWEAFTMVMSTPLTLAFFEAWSATRDTALEAVNTDEDRPNS